MNDLQNKKTAPYLRNLTWFAANQAERMENGQQQRCRRSPRGRTTAESRPRSPALRRPVFGKVRHFLETIQRFLRPRAGAADGFCRLRTDCHRAFGRKTDIASIGASTLTSATGTEPLGLAAAGRGCAPLFRATSVSTASLTQMHQLLTSARLRLASHEKNSFFVTLLQLRRFTE